MKKRNVPKLCACGCSGWIKNPYGPRYLPGHGFVESKTRGHSVNKDWLPEPPKPDPPMLERVVVNWSRAEARLRLEAQRVIDDENGVCCTCGEATDRTNAEGDRECIDCWLELRRLLRAHGGKVARGKKPRWSAKS